MKGNLGVFIAFMLNISDLKKNSLDWSWNIQNLLYACWKCNSFKGEDWPSDEPLKSGKGYLDPCTCDYEKYFIVNGNGKLKGSAKAATYMIERLHLNSYFLTKLRNERREIIESIEKHKLVVNQIETLLKTKRSSNETTVLRKIKAEMAALLKTQQEEFENRFSPPYELESIRDT